MSCVTAVDGEWLAELCPMCFSTKESFESALKRRQMERLNAAALEKEMEERNNLINMLLSNGEKISYVKITDMNIFENYLINSKLYKEFQINIVKECLENKWSFPSFQYYEKISPYLNYESNNANLFAYKNSSKKFLL